MLLILFGTLANVGHESRSFFEQQGFEIIQKFNYVPENHIINTYYGTRNFSQKEDVLKCDFVYDSAGMTIGFNQSQIIDAVSGKKNCLLTLSSHSIDFVEQIKLAYGDYVTVIFACIDPQTLHDIVSDLPGISDEEIAARLNVGIGIKEYFLKKRAFFDEIVIYNGEESTFDMDALLEQYRHILKKAEKKERNLNNRTYVELPYSGSDSYIFASYAHADQETVYPILTMLQRNGYKIWYDEGIKGGTNWRRLLVEKIRSCENFLLFCSKKSSGSIEVEYELGAALDFNKKLITIRLDDAVFSPEFETVIKRKQQIFYHNDSFAEKLMNSFDHAVKV